MVGRSFQALLISREFSFCLPFAKTTLFVHSRNPTDGVFSLNDEAPKPRPRAWERAPVSPVLARRHGRKVWKRYEAPARPEAMEGARDAEQTRHALGDATNSSRPVKRLRLKDGSKVEPDGRGSQAAPYFTTLRDKENAGTPRRKCGLQWYDLMHGTDVWCYVGKQASRKSDSRRAKMKITNADTRTTVDSPKNAVQDDVVRARESPAFEDVRELSSAGDDVTDAIEIAATNTSEHSKEIPMDERFFGTGDATSSETLPGIDQGFEASLEREAETLSEFHTIVDDVSETDSDVTSTKAASEGDNSRIFGYDAKSAANGTISSPSSHEETMHAEGVMTVENGTALSSSANHSSSVLETLPSDMAGVFWSPLKKSPRTTIEGGLVLEPPNFDSSSTPSAIAKTPRRSSPRKKPQLPSPHAVTSPEATCTPKLLIAANPLQADYPGDTPQIGTSLLRRESLRRKESPTRKKDTRKSKTPKKRDTLQRRDTLQEREILQKIIAETNADHSEEDKEIPLIGINPFLSSSDVPGAEDFIGDDVHGSPRFFLRKASPNVGTAFGDEAVLPAIDETSVKQDLHRAMEAIEAYDHPEIADASQTLLDVTSDDVQEIEALGKANQVLAKTELDDVSNALEAAKGQTPKRRTGSEARLSDDTSLLKDFLNRAQARKAAQVPLLSAPDAPIPLYSPRRSPRKTHGSQDGHALSPQKPRKIANRAGTPHGKPKTEALDSDDGEELIAEPASCRRSTRTRLPAPSKAPPGAPSFIPVRRADGTDPVVLHKSQVQELAVTTRANTRRNKGQSKPPLLALQDLPTGSADLAPWVKEGAEKAKSVAWATRLACYHDAKGEADEVEERRPKVSRLRGLSAANGTPAAKRTTAALSMSNGTPAPKRRGKV